MTPLVRFARGVLGTALVWGMGWFLVGLGFGTYRALTFRPFEPSDHAVWFRILVFVTAIWTVWGLVSGAAFAIAIAIAERRRNLTELSMLRVALWGALGANVLPFIFFIVVLAQTDEGFLGPFVIVASVCAAAGAAFAAGTLALARRATRVAA